jgi:hypothetical protein
MKTKLILAFLATVSLSQAAVVQYQTTFAQAITTAAGAFIPDAGGYTAVGYFTIADSAFATSTSLQLATAFQPFGLSGVFGFNGIGGVYDNSGSGGRVGAASPFLGKTIYVLNTNAATIAGSTQALIFKSAFTWSNDSAASLDENFLVALAAGGDAGYKFGGAAGPPVELVPAGVDPAYVVPGIAMAATVAVPEPSAALLGVIGALGLLRRRRN